ncbi:trypsin-like peptidase domain-containing protein [Botrimarina sp.]|uniref:S1C family serine protease n=1 Tax=Botrimarina sp. TaxID=2795802 RepID=UPI0032EF0C6C
MVLAAALGPAPWWAAPSAAQQAAAGGPGEAVKSLEQAVVGAIQRCEASVVSISLHNRGEVLLSDGASDVARARQRLLMQQQRQLPGALGVLSRPFAAPVLSEGAGVVIDPSGVILTEYSVVDLEQTHVVTTADGQRYVAQIRAADPRSGLAVLAIERRLPGDGQATAGGGRAASREGPINLPALPLGKAEDLRKGRFVIAIGNPFSIESDGQPTASWGTVTNTALKVPEGESLGDTPPTDGEYQTTLHHHGSLIQTDAKLGWNSAGGALVTLDGELVGLTTTAAVIAGHEQPAGYAIPINEAMRRVIDTLRDGRAPEYGLLGVTFDPGPAQSPLTGEVGIAVRNAFRGGPAARAGLRSQDLLLSVDGQRVTSPDALQLAVGSRAPGATTTVKYERSGAVDEAVVELGKAYVGQGQIVSRDPRSWRGIQVDYPTAIPPEALGVAAEQGQIDPDGCVVVADVDEQSDSWRRGIRPFVFISHVNGERVDSPGDFYEAVQRVEGGVRLTFTKPLADTPEPADAAEEPPQARRRTLQPPQRAPAQQ